MSLLREIQDAATSETTDITTVLRKCRILATRLNHQGLKNWTQCELDGYSEKAQLPDYRIIRCGSKGHFAGPFGSGLRNADIPLANLPDDIREEFSIARFYDGVSSLQDLVRSTVGSNPCQMWPADVCAIVGRGFYERMNLMQAWKEVPRNAVVGILDTVRNRVLNFALEIEAENPKAGEHVGSVTPVPSAKVQQIFNNYISGNVGNIASGSDHFTQSATIEVRNNNFDDLTNALAAIGMKADEISDLRHAIKADGKPSGNCIGNKVSDWLGKAISKSAQGLLKVGVDVAPKIIMGALHKYYGFPG